MLYVFKIKRSVYHQSEESRNMGKYIRKNTTERDNNTDYIKEVI